ncbi:MAG: RsmE family RNA methyltransferase [Planctomycetota bacterium]
MLLTEMPARFFSPSMPHPRVADPRCALGPEETRHARKVLRIAIGETVELFDGTGKVGTAILEDYASQGAICRLTSIAEADPLTPRITVATAIPKGTKAEDMVNQLSQLGADRVIPMITHRSVVDPRDGKVERFRRVALEAAKQSGRLTLMEITQPVPFHEVLAEVCDFGVVCCPRKDRPGDLPEQLRDCQDAIVLIGPEGGFTDEETHRACHAGYVPWSISPNVLRIETAAVTAVSLMRYLA